MYDPPQIICMSPNLVCHIGDPSIGHWPVRQIGPRRPVLSDSHVKAFTYAAIKFHMGELAQLNVPQANNFSPPPTIPGMFIGQSSLPFRGRSSARSDSEGQRMFTPKHFFGLLCQQRMSNGEHSQRGQSWPCIVTRGRGFLTK